MGWKSSAQEKNPLTSSPKQHNPPKQNTVQEEKMVTGNHCRNSEHLHVDAKTHDALPIAARFLPEANRLFKLHLDLGLLAIEVLSLQSWLYRTVYLFHQAGPGSIRSTKPSMTSIFKQRTTMAFPPANSSKQPSPSQRSLVRYNLLKCFKSFKDRQAYRLADVLGSIAFTPVKNDMIGNIKVSTHLRPVPSNFRELPTD